MNNYEKDINNKFIVNSFDLYPDFKGASLRLELSNICNHNCTFCSNSRMTRKRIHMEEELIYRILKEAAEMGIVKVGLFMNGEPFASENLDKYIKYCKDIGYEYVFITTNGSLADEKRLKDVFDAGLDSIKFSINAGTAETYKKIHGHDHFEKVISNLKFAVEYREKSKLNYKILTSFVITKDNMNEMRMHYDNMKNLVDDIVFFRMSNFGGYSVEESETIGVDAVDETLPIFVEKNISKQPCPLLFNYITITCEGYLTLCQGETLNYMAVEDVHGKSLKDAVYSAKMVEMRKRHLTNDLEGTQCYNCIHNVNTKVEPLNKELYDKCQK